MRSLLVASLLFSAAVLPGSALAQDTPPPSEVKGTDKSARAEAIYVKMRQVDLLTQLMPLLLTKKQINDILTTLEKARRDQQVILDAEAGQMVALEKELDEAIADAENAGKYPPKEIRGRIYALTGKMSILRTAARDGIILRTDAALQKILNEGQLKAMVGTVLPKEINPMKPEEVTDQMRRRFYVATILLDPMCYDILRKLYKKAN